MSGETAGVDEEELAKLQKEIRAPFLQVVGFDKINMRQSDFKQLRIISLQDNLVSGLGCGDERSVAAIIPNVTELDVSFNLICDWNEIIEFGKQLKKLKVLNVSGNNFTWSDYLGS